MSLLDVLCYDRANGMLQWVLAGDRLVYAYIFAVVDATGGVEATHREIVTILQKRHWLVDRERG